MWYVDQRQVVQNLINPLHPKSDLDFTLSNARQFYSSKGDPLGLKGLKKLSPLTLYALRVTSRFSSV